MNQPPARRPRIAITLGDPCGVGSELLLGSLHAINRWADVIVVGAKAGPDLLEKPVGDDSRIQWRWSGAPGGSPTLLDSNSYSLWTVAGKEWNPGQPQLQGHALWIDPVPGITASQLVLGEGSANSGKAAVESVAAGARLVMAGVADALVTLPLSKSAAHQAGYDIPGHTEFLQRLSGARLTRMAFVSPSLNVVLHTVHQSLRSAMDGLSVDAVAETLSFAADRFIQLTGKRDLRVALCALNPHAGEGGAFGDEESMLSEAVVVAEASFLDFGLKENALPYGNVASPFLFGDMPDGWEIFPTKPRTAFQPSRSPLPRPAEPEEMELIEIDPQAPSTAGQPTPRFFGPLPADTLFLRAVQGEFDLVVALFHDQGLIPMKVLEPKRAVNLTLGLPFIRTSPDHGTAFDKAGKWIADPANFLEATALAVRLAARAKHASWKAEVGPDGTV